MTPEDINAQFLWPRAADLGAVAGTPLYKSDPLLARLETLITERKAWAPIKGSTKRTEPGEKLRLWLEQQHRHQAVVEKRLGSGYDMALRIEDFPVVSNPTRPGTHVISTSRNIVYLLDSTTDFLGALGGAFGKSKCELAKQVMDETLGVLVYVTNSVESGGRAFSGDPFTGQVAAYSRIFAFDLLGRRVLNLVPYYPHQLYTQMITANGRTPENKGVRMLRGQATLIVTCGGVLIHPRDWRVMG